MRQWRALILYRSKLVGRRKAIKNSIRSLLDRQGMTMPIGAKAWTIKAVAALSLLARPLASCDPEDLWRGQLEIELTAYAQAQALVDQVEVKLDALASQDVTVHGFALEG